MTAAPVLMDVLDRVESPGFQDMLAETGGLDRPDGVRPMAWELCYKLAHAIPSNGQTTWLQELEHSHAHVMAASDEEQLRAALIAHAALTAAWVAALDARGAEA